MSEANRINAAADWLLRLQSETASDATIRSWVQWCEADVRNQRAFDQVRETLQIADGLAGEVENGELIGASMEVPRGRFERFMAGWREAWRVSLQYPLQYPLSTMAASVAALAVAALAWVTLTSTGHLPVRNGAVIESDEAVHAAMLPDGSRVELASKSTLAVHYTGAARSLDLRDGEAYFTVTPNKRRPFIVTADGVSVRAVGTAFNVRSAAGRVVVTVTEGTVDIYQQSSRSAPAGKPVRAGAGFQVVWQTGGAAPGQAERAQAGAEPARVSVKPATAVGWREGRLEYLDEPLEAVVADVNRYAIRPVVIADDAARKLRFSGTVMVGLTDEWLSALPRQFPVTLQRQNGVDMIHSVAADSR